MEPAATEDAEMNSMAQNVQGGATDNSTAHQSPTAQEESRPRRKKVQLVRRYARAGGTLRSPAIPESPRMRPRRAFSPISPSIGAGPATPTIVRQQTALSNTVAAGGSTFNYLQDPALMSPFDARQHAYELSKEIIDLRITLMKKEARLDAALRAAGRG
ncbi:hypothetical protein CVT24_007448 [Panaeolus cyanescens]|uniref:Uncharacterized protein n=1 Tax=Panaeolus cyanescens TaxID=181874 RepID=A0A409W4X4_9AGAR|nr:hypothetical protein CVT24_007448 [Panaeolus cyanescens]